MDAAELAPERYAARARRSVAGQRADDGGAADAGLSRARARTRASATGRGACSTSGSARATCCARIARWGDERGVALELVGVDLNPQERAAARGAYGSARLRDRLITGDYRAIWRGEGWDIILSSLVTHHMTPRQRIEFLRFMEARRRAAGWSTTCTASASRFAGFPLLATLAWVDPIVRRDGQLSIARSYRRARMAGDAGRSAARHGRRLPYLPQLSLSAVRRTHPLTSRRSSSAPARRVGRGDRAGARAGARRCCSNARARRATRCAAGS